jgi:hypothetical protein
MMQTMLLFLVVLSLLAIVFTICSARVHALYKDVE